MVIKDFGFDPQRALDQIKRTRQDGYALAVAGIVIGIATLIVALIVMIFAVHSH